MLRSTKVPSAKWFYEDMLIVAKNNKVQRSAGAMKIGLYPLDT